MNQLDLLATDAVNTFLVDFGESIVYTPYQSSPSTIQALVYRNVPTANFGLTGSASYKHEIMIANDAVAGVIAINKGKDAVQLSNTIGGAVETFTVMQIIQNDEGVWHLGVG